MARKKEEIQCEHIRSTHPNINRSEKKEEKNLSWRLYYMRKRQTDSAPNKKLTSNNIKWNEIKIKSLQQYQKSVTTNNKVSAFMRTKDRNLLPSITFFFFWFCHARQTFSLTHNISSSFRLCILEAYMRTVHIFLNCDGWTFHWTPILCYFSRFAVRVLISNWCTCYRSRWIEGFGYICVCSYGSNMHEILSEHG